MPVYDNPVQGLLFECDVCGKELFLGFLGRTHQELAERAREREWQVDNLRVVSAGATTCVSSKVLCPDREGKHAAKLRLAVV